SKTTIVLGPRSVPAAASCSEAIATTLPSGDSWVPASERSKTGSPAIASTALWSRCSWVTISRSTVAGGEIVGYPHSMPGQPPPERSPNGSMKTVAASPSSVNADCPCQSTRMTLLQFAYRWGRRGGLRLARLGVGVAPAPHQRGARGDQAGDDGEAEGGVEAVAERLRDQAREEAVAGQHRLGVLRQLVQGPGADQVFDRVVAEEGGEEHRDRGRFADFVRFRVTDAVRFEAAR